MSGAPESRPLPVADPLTAPFWEAAGEGRLLLQRCSGCGRYQFYPRGHCTGCWGRELDWVASKGCGTLHAFAVVRRATDPAFADDVPYAFALVDLDEGVRVASRLDGTPTGELAVGVPVRVAFQPRGSVSLPFFVPLGGQR